MYMKVVIRSTDNKNAILKIRLPICFLFRVISETAAPFLREDSWCYRESFSLRLFHKNKLFFIYFNASAGKMAGKLVINKIVTVLNKEKTACKCFFTALL